MDLPTGIAALIRDAIAGTNVSHRDIDGVAARQGAIALMGTMTDLWVLRPDGTFWSVDFENDDKPPEPLAASEHVRAIAYGVQRFPWLEELLPQRPSGATDCPNCEGLGGLPVPPSFNLPPVRLLCFECDGLGWVQ